MLIDYYYDFSLEMDKNFSGLIFDSKGIPMVNYRKKIGIQYNPVTVAQYSLAHLSLYIRTKDDKYKKIFLNGAEWFLMNVSDYKNDSLVWFYKFDLTECELKSPWISAMAQGLAVSVLIRANQMTGNKDFLDTAEKAVNVFDIQVHEGGVMSTFPDGEIVFEEYPTGSINCVLNGFIFSVLGLYDLFIFAKNKKAEKLFNQSIKSLKDNFKRYDTGYWSRYDLRSDKRLASIHYHLLHIRLLDILYEITQDVYFIQLRNKWNEYYRSIFCRIKFIFKKFLQKVFR